MAWNGSQSILFGWGGGGGLLQTNFLHDLDGENMMRLCLKGKLIQGKSPHELKLKLWIMLFLWKRPPPRLVMSWLVWNMQRYHWKTWPQSQYALRSQLKELQVQSRDFFAQLNWPSVWLVSHLIGQLGDQQGETTVHIPGSHRWKPTEINANVPGLHQYRAGWVGGGGFSIWKDVWDQFFFVSLHIHMMSAPSFPAEYCTVVHCTLTISGFNAVADLCCQTRFVLYHSHVPQLHDRSQQEDDVLVLDSTAVTAAPLSAVT